MLTSRCPTELAIPASRDACCEFQSLALYDVSARGGSMTLDGRCGGRVEACWIKNNLPPFVPPAATRLRASAFQPRPDHTPFLHRLHRRRTPRRHRAARSSSLALGLLRARGLLRCLGSLEQLHLPMRTVSKRELQAQATTPSRPAGRVAWLLFTPAWRA